jgi:hypothetical protein
MPIVIVLLDLQKASIDLGFYLIRLRFVPVRIFNGFDERDHRFYLYSIPYKNASGKGRTFVNTPATVSLVATAAYTKLGIALLRLVCLILVVASATKGLSAQAGPQEPAKISRIETHEQGWFSMKALLVLMLMTAPWTAKAELTIFDVRKNLAMSDADKVYRDFYINGGSESGLSQGMIITVQRRQPLYDSYQNRSAGDLQLKVAKIKIIHVQKGLAVARLHTEFTRDNAPILEDNFIMTGDQLDLSSATTEKEGKRADNDATPQPTPVAAANVEKSNVQIVVNSVELSSEAPKPTPPTPTHLDQPVLQ